MALLHFVILALLVPHAMSTICTDDKGCQDTPKETATCGNQVGTKYCICKADNAYEDTTVKDCADFTNLIPILTFDKANLKSVAADTVLTLTCTLAGLPNPTVSYKFYKVGTTAALTSATVTITEDAGYTCEVHSNNKQSKPSAAVDVQLLREPGKACKSDADCASTVGYTGKCPVETKRCTCSTGYTARDSMCSALGKVCWEGNAATACKGNGYTGKCVDERCVCQGGYKAEGDKCSGADQIATVSLFGLLIAFFVSTMFK